jgi:hypothetical protein
MIISETESDFEEDFTPVDQVPVVNPVKAKTKELKTRSWVYLHADKNEENGKLFFRCRYQFKSGKYCSYKCSTKQGSTTTILNHLKEKHSLKPPEKTNQTVDREAILTVFTH